MSASRKIIDQLEEALTEDYYKKLIAQIDARHILEQTFEKKDNYPKFDVHLQEKITHLAYLEIMVGCSLIEQDDDKRGYEYLEKAGKLIGDAFLYEGDDITRNFQLLIGGMALYASNQYSRAFVMLKSVKGQDIVSKMVVAFLRKDIVTLERTATQIFFEAGDCDELVFEKELSRAFLTLISYIRFGNKTSIHFLYRTMDLLVELKEIEYD